METELIKFVAVIFVITNPIGAIPIFLSLTKDETPAERKTAALLAALTVGIVLSANVLVGETIRSLSGISVPSFQVVGKS